MQPVFRFAPSPTGELHLGHAFSALYDYEICRRAGGRFLLRIEDIDVTRCRPEHEAGIYRDLAWLGLEWEEPVRRQSDHFADYAAALSRLKEAGLTYPGFMTRSEIAAATRAPEWPRDPDGVPLYPPLDRSRPKTEVDRLIKDGTPHTWRLANDRAVAAAGPLAWSDDGPGPAGETGLIAARPEQWGDFVIARKDVPTSYHLSVVVDDALQGVTHVVRGRDLFHATSAHVLLQALLDLPTPRYRHHPLINDESGQKLSKSLRSSGLRALREAGATPTDIRRMVGLDAALARLG